MKIVVFYLIYHEHFISETCLTLSLKLTKIEISYFIRKIRPGANFFVLGNTQSSTENCYNARYDWDFSLCFVAKLEKFPEIGPFLCWAHKGNLVTLRLWSLTLNVFLDTNLLGYVCSLRSNDVCSFEYALFAFWCYGTAQSNKHDYRETCSKLCCGVTNGMINIKICIFTKSTM